MKVRLDSLTPGRVCRRDAGAPMWEVVSVNAGSVTVRERSSPKLVQFDDKRTGKRRQFTTVRGRQYTVAQDVLVEPVDG